MRITLCRTAIWRKAATTNPNIISTSRKAMSLAKGSVSPGFETVKEMFETMLRTGCDKRAQLCVYVGDQRVVDLWGTAADVVDEKFGPDSLVNVFSSTKTITAIVVAKMVDQGLLRYLLMVSLFHVKIVKLIKLISYTSLRESSSITI